MAHHRKSPTEDEPPRGEDEQVRGIADEGDDLDDLIGDEDVDEEQGDQDEEDLTF